jgi:hypothetical protein
MVDNNEVGSILSPKCTEISEELSDSFIVAKITQEYLPKRVNVYTLRSVFFNDGFDKFATFRLVDWN